MGASTTRLMTVEEFRDLPLSKGHRYELRQGEITAVTRPKLKHYLLQSRLRDLLRLRSGGQGLLEIEFAFRALPQYEYRVADVAWVNAERWRTVNLEDNLRGAPDLVIEILSPSNTAVEMFEKEKLCIENGCIEFWVIDADLHQVKVTRRDGITTTYLAGSRIPLAIFGCGGDIAVNEILNVEY